MVRVSDQVAELAHENGLKVTDAIAGSLLPTPTVSDTFTAGLASTQQVEGSLHSVSLAQIVNRADLFPTPNTMDFMPARSPERKALYKGQGGYSNLRESVVNDLLPTPQAMEGFNGNNLTIAQRAATGQVMLSNYAIDYKNDWGKFEPAIRRWEQVIGRPAPNPTLPDGKEGAHRLSPFFTEWLMGLPEGLVTNSGLTRNEQLKACGNGVVPQQAELALRLLLQRLDTNHNEH